MTWRTAMAVVVLVVGATGCSDDDASASQFCQDARTVDATSRASVGVSADAIAALESAVESAPEEMRASVALSLEAAELRRAVGDDDPRYDAFLREHQEALRALTNYLAQECGIGS